jgi:predicted dehydrogenase
MTVNIALAGPGYWGPNLARNFAALPGARLHTLCDVRTERLEELRKDYPHAKLEREFEAVLSDPDVHAIVIATPVYTHFELALAALRAGKHVMVEKPMAKTLAQCRELVALANKRNLTLMTGHVFLYNAAVRKVKEYIDSGELGDIHYVCSQRLNLGIVRRDVNALWNFAPHDVSILNYWFGSTPVAASARGFSYLQPGIEDVVFMTLEFPGGVGANVHLSWLDPRKVRAMTVVGSKKMVVYDDIDPDAHLTLYDKGITKQVMLPRDESLPPGPGDFGEFRLLTRAGDIVIPRFEYPEPLRVECRHFVECVTNGKKPLTDGEEGLRVVATLEAAQASLERNGERVPIETSLASASSLSEGTF